MPKTRVVEIIEEASRYIEDNLAESISLDSISNHLGFSKYHLHRIFKALTGKGLIEYSRSRRLAASLNDLVDTGSSILEIALKYGFSHEPSYIRAFCNEFSISPGRYRRQCTPLSVTLPLDSTLLTEADDSLFVQPFFVFKPSFTIGGIYQRITAEDGFLAASQAAQHFFFHRRQEISNPVHPNRYIGFTNWNTMQFGYTDYLSGIEIADPADLPSGFDSESVPSTYYAVFRFIGLFNPRQLSAVHIQDIWRFADCVWLKAKGISRSQLYSFELVDMDIARDDYCELDLYVQVID